MVYPDLNVAENIFISHEDRGPVVRWGKMYADAEAILAKLGVRLDVRMPARGLTLAAQQAVEIAKAISLKVRVLIMDEPTASLSAARGDPALHSWCARCAARASPSSSSATGWRKSSNRRPHHGPARRQVDLHPAARRGDHEHVIRDMVGREVRTSSPRARPTAAIC